MHSRCPSHAVVWCTDGCHLCVRRPGRDRTAGGRRPRPDGRGAGAGDGGGGVEVVPPPPPAGSTAAVGGGGVGDGTDVATGGAEAIVARGRSACGDALVVRLAPPVGCCGCVALALPTVERQWWGCACTWRVVRVVVWWQRRRERARLERVDHHHHDGVGGGSGGGAEGNGGGGWRGVASPRQTPSPRVAATCSGTSCVSMGTSLTIERRRDVG